MRLKTAVIKIIAIDGIRRQTDIKFLGKLPEFKLAYIEADVEKRYQRISVRGENPDDNSKTLEQFKKELEQESETQIRDLKKIANHIIDNNGSKEDLYAQIDKIINLIP